MMLARRQLLVLAAAAALPGTARTARALGVATTWKTLAGPFVQERTLGLFKQTVRSQGRLTLVRPDRLRWELFAPDEIVYWATPEVLAYRSRQGVGRMPASAGRLAASMADLRALLVGDLNALRARYDVKEGGTDAAPVVEAAPKEGTKLPFKKLTLELAADRIRPVRASLVEGPKDQTLIRFGDLVLDGPVDPREMEPPRA
jgi:outer membrane lipoprotein-sorting protein